MSKIDRGSRIVVKFKGGKSMESLAKKYKLKPPTVERIVRNWFNDIAGIALRTGDGTLWHGRDAAEFPSSGNRARQR